MKVELKPFQEDAVNELLTEIGKMQDMYDRYGDKTAISLTAPTGAGKTVMAAAVVESLFFGNLDAGVEADPKACVLWLSDSPSLNDQTRNRFVEVSEKLAQWYTDQSHLEIVQNNFGAGHERLEPRHVYFMSKDLLGKGKLLTKGGEENNGRVFWDILDTTINDPDCHPYLIIDEAHRGLGANASAEEKSQQTIYASLIDGYDGRAAMPVVIGVSATPKRFETAMMQRKSRNLRNAITVTPRQVQESGLLKDTIELRVPEQDDAVDHQYLDMACDRLKAADESWRAYCKSEEIDPPVAPLMVVQVKDRIGNEELKNMCEQICRRIPKLDGHMAFANVFGEHADLVPSAKYFIPYIEPELVEHTRCVRVLFAKEAISNGWDCPRAEVIFSQRRRSDDTYIAQLVGRMVRTPLARRVDADETLNSVACYLPQFNPEATQSVIDYLTGKSGDSIGGSYVPNVFTNSVEVTWQQPVTNPGTEGDAGVGGSSISPVDGVSSQGGAAALGGSSPAGPEASGGDDGSLGGLFGPDDYSGYEGLDVSPKPPVRPVAPKPVQKQVFTKEELDSIDAAFKTLRKRVFPKKARNEFVSLIKTGTLLMDTGLDKGAGADIREGFCLRLDAEIVAHPKEYNAQKYNVEIAEMQVITIDKLNENAVTRESLAPRSDAQGIAEAAKQALVVFGGKELVNAYKKRLIKQGKDFDDADLALASACRADVIVDALKRWADDKRAEYFDAHAADRNYLPEEDRQKYDALLQETKGVHDIPVERPTKRVMNADWPRFPKHIIFDLDGLCPLDVRPFEAFVINKELERDRTVAFYRNPNNNSPQVFSIPYKMPDGRRALRPDFIFFTRDAEGVVRPAIIDPHGDFLEDTLPKLKGYVDYLRDYPDEFAQVLVLSEVADGDTRFLDLLDAATQNAIMNFTGDHVEELYTGEFSRYYGRREQ